jgi:hypothetical protein
VSGSALTITPDASSVTVTWSTGARPGFRPWAVARTYRA